MKKNLVKMGAGLAAAASSLYWGVGMAYAGLCPTDANIIKPPGCDSTGNDVSLDKIVGSGINLALFVAFVAALIFLIIGGIKWIMSAGDKDGASKAKETVTSALIGLAVVIASYILINIVLQFFGATGGLASLTFPKFEWKAVSGGK